MEYSSLLKIPCFLKCSPDLELNLVSNEIQVNLPIQINRLIVSIWPLLIWTLVIMGHEIN